MCVCVCIYIYINTRTLQFSSELGLFFNFAPDSSKKFKIPRQIYQAASVHMSFRRLKTQKTKMNTQCCLS